MIQVYLYVHKDQEETKSIVELLNRYQQEFPHKLSFITIENDNYLKVAYKNKDSVLDIGPYRLLEPIKEDEIKFAFTETTKKLEAAESIGNTLIKERFTEVPKIIGSDKFSYWFSKHYMFLFNLAVFFYVGFAFLAPVLMKLEKPKAANVIYKIYSPLCHQLAFRSFFIFGEQYAYPRDLANVESLKTYGEETGFDEFDIVTARNFVGNEILGYKVALCERDIAIYLAIFAFGVIFSISRNRINSIPWYLWIILGIVPIGLDGFSQLLSQTGIPLLSWIPLRESSPLLRALTGGLFGLFTAWFGYPFVEESVAESRNQIENKMALIRQLDKDKGKKPN
ncbi:MAG: DUF2085 domain-containing protein [Anaerolineaceae bacterium]|nr:DUF2085 domain-containing protein [Anaerolineaceae bacterium]